MSGLNLGVCLHDLPRDFIHHAHLIESLLVVHSTRLTTSEFDAAVVRSSWSLQESNRSLRAEIDVPNLHGIMRPGMYAMATIKLAERENAIVRDAAGTACMVVDDGKIVRCPVELGLRSGSEIEILSGIEESQVVVLKQPEALKPGQSAGVAPATK